MAKDTGILLDPATGDLAVSARRDGAGLIAQGLEVGTATFQNQALILKRPKESSRSTRHSVSGFRTSWAMMR